MIYVAEIQYWDSVAYDVAYYYAATEAFTTSPASTPANTVFHPRITNPALLRRDIFDLGTTGGASRVGYGELVLANDDGGLDVFATRPMDGRTLVLRVADSATAAYPSAWAVLFTGVMEEVQLTQRQLRIRLRDRQVFATKAFQPNKYRGNNLLPLGLEGLPSDLAGKPKPRMLGWVFNGRPANVNTSLLIYQVDDATNYGTIRDVTAVYDGGALLTHGTDYASQTEMMSIAPAAGEYRVSLSDGMFRLGSSPYGEVTFDGVKGMTPANRTAGQLFNEVLLAAGIPSNQISAADVAALDVANRASLEIYIDEETTNQEVLDLIARSVGAWWASDTDGILRIQRLEIATGTPVISITTDGPYKIVEGTLERVPLNKDGLPPWRVIVRCVPNYTVQTSGLVGIVTPERKARLASQYQDQEYNDSSTSDAYLLSPELKIETALACDADGLTEAERLWNLFTDINYFGRDRFELQVQADTSLLLLLDLGIVVNLTADRFGLTGGRLFRVIGYQLDPTLNTASLTLWG